MIALRSFQKRLSIEPRLYDVIGCHIHQPIHLCRLFDPISIHFRKLIQMLKNPFELAGKPFHILIC